jgi:hypothetical protein
MRTPSKYPLVPQPAHGTIPANSPLGNGRMMEIILLIVGLVLLVLGAEVLVHPVLRQPSVFLRW